MDALKAPSKCGLIKSLVQHEVNELIYRMQRILSSSKGAYVRPFEWGVPKSIKANKILELAKQLNHPEILNHGLRSFAFGKILMRLSGEKVDDEVFFAGSLLHDLGLMRDCTGSSFELVGANEAYEHCEEIFEKRDLEVLYEMILLHDAIGMASDKSLELKYLHYGAGIDVADLWTHRISVENYKEVYNKYPSHNHIEFMISLLKQRLNENPKMYLSTLMKLGFTRKMRKHQSLKL